jgi:hypothetical protein
LIDSGFRIFISPFDSVQRKGFGRAAVRDDVSESSSFCLFAMKEGKSSTFHLPPFASHDS